MTYLKFILSMAIAMPVFAATNAPQMVNETSLKSPSSWQSIENNRVIYLDKNQELFVASTDGTHRHSLSRIGEKKLQVVGTGPQDFAYVSGSDTLYFQAQETPTSFKLYLYKTSLSGNSEPQQKIRINRPLRSLRASPDGRFVLMQGDSSHSLLRTSNDISVKIEIAAMASAPLHISPDFKYLLYFEEVQIKYETRFHLKSINLETNKITTILADQSTFNFTIDFARDSSSAAIASIGSEYRPAMRPTLVWRQLDGSDQKTFFPSANPSANEVSFGFQTFIAGIRGAGDPGSLIFETRQSNLAPTLQLVSLFDLLPTSINTNLVVGDRLSGFKLSPDSSKLIYLRNANNDFNGGDEVPRVYLIDLKDIAAIPKSLFEARFQELTMLADNQNLVFLSQGGYFEANQFIKVALDGRTSHTVVSDGFPKDWLLPTEYISELTASATPTVFFVKTNSTPEDTQFNLMSFVP